MTPEETEVYKYLDVAGIEYTAVQHARVSTIEECRLPMRLLNAVMPKNLLLCPKNRSAYYLLLMHPDSVFNTSSVSHHAGASRLSFADERALKELMHTHSGALSPFGLIYASAADIQLLIDKCLLSEESLVFHPLENTASVKISTQDFLEKFLGRCGHSYIEIELESADNRL